MLSWCNGQHTVLISQKLGFNSQRKQHIESNTAKATQHQELQYHICYDIIRIRK